MVFESWNLHQNCNCVLSSKSWKFMFFLHQTCKHRFTLIIYIHFAPPIFTEKQQITISSCSLSMHTSFCFSIYMYLSTSEFVDPTSPGGSGRSWTLLAAPGGSSRLLDAPGGGNRETQEWRDCGISETGWVHNYGIGPEQGNVRIVVGGLGLEQGNVRIVPDFKKVGLTTPRRRPIVLLAGYKREQFGLSWDKKRLRTQWTLC